MRDAAARTGRDTRAVTAAVARSARLAAIRTSVRFSPGASMRTYAPAATERRPGPSCSRSRRSPAASSTTRSCPPRDGGLRATFPDWLDPRIVAGLAGRGHRAAVHPPGGGDRGGPRRRGRRRRHADRVGQDAVLHAARSSRPSPRTRPRGRCSCSRPRRSARTRSRSSASCRAAAGLTISASTYDGDTPAPIRSAIRGGRPGRRHQPGHAPLGDPAPPHEVVPAVRAAAGHRHRRAAHVSRRLRQPRRQRPAPAAPASAPTTARHPVIVCCSATIGNPAELAAHADRPAGRGSSTATARRPASGTSLLVDPPILDPATRRPRLGR